jgi:hypothetical protein
MIEKINQYGKYIYYDCSMWRPYFAWKPMKAHNKLVWLRWLWKRHITYGRPELKTEYIPMVKEKK